MPNVQWYVAAGSQRLGPYLPEQIPQLIREGKIRPETYVWNAEMEGWAAAQDVPEIKLRLRDAPAAAPAPAAAVSRDVLSKLVDQVTAEVTAQVMDNYDDYARDATLGESGRHVAVTDKPAAPPVRPRAPEPARPATPAASPAQAPVAPAPVRPSVAPAAAAPVRPAEPVTRTPVPAAAPGSPRAPEPARVASAPVVPVSSVARPVEPAVRPAASPVPVTAMPPDPYAKMFPATPAAPSDDIAIRILGAVCKGAGFVGLVFGLVTLIKFLFEAFSASGAVKIVSHISLGLMPLLISLGVFTWGFLIDLWLRQSDQLRELLDQAKKKPGGA
jgi:hypothetical protein